MKLLALHVENLCGVPDGPYSFAEADGSAPDVVVLADAGAGALLETIAALFEALRATAAPHTRAWWARRRGPGEARLRVRWALSEAEAARARVSGRTAISEWRFGPHDELPRELPVEVALSRRARVDLARYAHLDANRSAVWMGGPEADTMAAALAQIAEREIAATQVWCRPGVGLVAWKTPDSLSELSRAIAPILPALRLERVSCAQGGMPVASFRGERRVELDQLDDDERDAIYIVAALHAARVRDGVVLIDSPELHVAREEHARWLGWLAGVAAPDQLVVATASSGPLASEPAAVGVSGPAKRALQGVEGS